MLKVVNNTTFNIYNFYTHNGDDIHFNFQRKRYWTQNVCFDFLYNVCLKHFSF